MFEWALVECGWLNPRVKVDGFKTYLAEERLCHKACHKLEATCDGGLFGYIKMIAPHSGQSSQLVFEANARSAQFLSKVTRSALIRRAIHIPHRVAMLLR